MRGFFLYLSCIGLLLVAGTSLGAGTDTTQPDAPTPDLAGLIQKLGDPDFRVRDAAEHRLWETGTSAEPLLQQAVGNSDPEISMRARRLLTDITLGITPGTPDKIMELLLNYRGGTVARKTEIVGQLQAMAPLSAHALGRLWLAEKDPAVREAVFRQCPAGDMLSWARAMIADGDENGAPELMRVLAFTDSDQLPRNAAGYFLLSGKLEAEIAAAEGQLGGKDAVAAGRFLIYAYRAHGDLERAEKMAVKYADPTVQAAIAEERGDWPAAITDFTRISSVWNTSVPVASRLAIYYRLTGNEAKADVETDRVIAAAQNSPQLLKAYFLNDRPAAGISAMLKGSQAGTLGDQAEAQCIELLGGQLRFDEAIDRVEKTDQRAFGPMLELAAELNQFGAREKAGKIFDELVTGAATGKTASQCWQLAYQLHAAGRNDLATKLADEMFAALGENTASEGVFYATLPNNALQPQRWVAIARQLHPDEKSAALSARLEKLFTGKLPLDEARDIINRAMPAEDPAADNDLLLCDIVRFTAQEGLDDAHLEKYVARATGSEPLHVLGDMLAGKGQWERAADAYARAWARDRAARSENALNLALEGNALQRAGEMEEGTRLIERAMRIGACSNESTSAFVNGLKLDGLEQPARRAEDLAMTIGAFDDFTALQASTERAAALAATDPMAAAAMSERQILWNVRPTASFLGAAAYVIVPHQIHVWRAMGFERTGDVEAALGECKLGLQYAPLDPDCASIAARVLDKAGRAKEADGFYLPVRDGLQALCREYPQSPAAHNNLAWLAARSHRDLDLALEHANKAIELDATIAGHFDTLAEVYLARGDKARALQAMRKAVAIDPKKPLYQQRLKEFEDAK